MNAARSCSAQVVPLPLVPLPLAPLAATLARLRLLLRPALESMDASEACWRYGAPWRGLRQLLLRLEQGFELEAQPLFALPCFETHIQGERVALVHARSRQAAAQPLLLLHGLHAPLAEHQHLIEPLTRPGGAAFHVVCPSLFGSGAQAGPRAAAARAAELMQRRGYARYAVHGSDVGAKVALELAALSPAQVSAVNVTAIAAYPGPGAAELESLDSGEKSKLAGLTELFLERARNWPRSPVEELAFALARLDELEQSPLPDATQDTLLLGLLLSAQHEARARAALYRARLAPSPASRVPVSVQAFPLDAPTLRRFAERTHRVVEYREHGRGGCMPALEQPELLLASLRESLVPEQAITERA